MAANRNREEKVYAAVETGEIIIRPDGSCWRTAIRQGRRGHKGETRTVQVPLRRAENRTRAGYLEVRVMYDGKRWAAPAHRLVWRHFHGRLPAGSGVIRHKNEIRTDNRPSNLRMAGGK